MYEAFYDLKEKPFNITPNPALVYGSKRHKQALIYLDYALFDDIGFVLFTGDIGTGKTTLLRRFLSESTPDIDIANIFNTNVSAIELLRFILREYEIEPIPDNKVDCITALNDYCIKNFSKNRRTLLIIDEAQNLSPEALEEIRLLSNLQSNNQCLLQIILCGQPELKEIINEPGLEQLSQRIAVRYHLTPLNREETGEYIHFRLEAVQAKNIELFSEDAIDLIFEHTGGTPRSINILCNTALVCGFADELPQITKEVVQTAIEEAGGIADQASAPLLAAPNLVHNTGKPAGCSPQKQQGEKSLHWEYTGYAQRIDALQNELKRHADRITWLETNQVAGGGDDKVLDALTSLLDTERSRYEQLQRHTVKLEQMVLALQKRLSNYEDNK